MSEEIGRLTGALASRYAIERELGAGGMATVYLAQDIRHGRPVALKVLRPELAAVIGGERFLAEIKVTANLQHPHILPLHDSGEADGFLFYVMPYVEGESLRERLTREKQLPVGEAVRIATEVAAALDYAHRHGVIHRDIKPENILLHDAQALVADFGIALAVSTAGGTRLTETGLSLGTPHYMSPEQAMGEREITARSDVYALGATLYEMLVGEAPFTGPTAQSIVAKVVTEEPRPLIPQRHTVPAEVEAAVLTALEKLPADRFATAAAFAEALADTDFRLPRLSRALVRSPVTPARTVWTLAALLVVATVAAFWGWLRPSNRQEITRRVDMQLPSVPALSADGSLLVYAADDGGRRVIVARRAASLAALPIPGTEGGEALFLSPDGASVGFFRDGQIFVVPTSGGVPARVPGATPLPLEEGPPAWAPDGGIVYTDRGGGLILVRSDGSSPDTLTRPSPGVRHLAPVVLPDGRAVLYSVIPHGDVSRQSIEAVSIASKKATALLTGGVTSPHYAGGYLLYARVDGTLMAVPFDARRVALAGEPVPLPDRVTIARFGVADFAVATGLLVYAAPGSAAYLVELDRNGRSHRFVSEPGSWHHPRYAPDGHAIVLDRGGGTAESRDVWVLDRRSGTLSRVSRVGNGHDPVWTPDGKGVTFFSFGAEGNPLKTAPADGSGDPVALPPAMNKGTALDIVNPGAWLPDGSGYIAGVRDPSGLSDLWVISSRAEVAQTPLVTSSDDEHSPAVSADGRWLAYRSDETGRAEIYLRPFGASGGRLQVSNLGGEAPIWGKQGERLYYLEPRGRATRLVEARLRLSPVPTVASRTVLFDDLRIATATNHTNYDVDPAGTHFVVVEPEMAAGRVVGVFGWASSLVAVTNRAGRAPHSP